MAQIAGGIGLAVVQQGNLDLGQGGGALESEVQPLPGDRVDAMGGIALMARGVFSQAEDRKLLPLALGSACATATYTLIDGQGGSV